MSLFDQYDEESSTSFLRQYEQTSARPKIKGTYDDEEGKPPIFKRHRINFSPEDVITHLAVSNNQMILAMRNKKLLRINLMEPDQPIEIELAQFLGDKAQMAKLYQVYLSPSGKHSLLSFASDLKNLTPFDNLYLSKKVHQASKLKGHLITAVAWNFINEKENTTSNILIGTSKGLIFETELAPDETKWLINTSLEKYLNQVFDVGSETGPVTAIQFHKAQGFDQTYFILVTTASRLYQCVGKASSNSEGPNLVNVFNTNTGQFQDMPGNLGFSKLDFYYTTTFYPETFGWLTEPGILYGKIGYNPSISLTTVTKDTSLISYLEDNTYQNISPSAPKEKPLGIILTKFHVLVLFRHLLRVICVLSEDIVMEDKFTETCGSVIGIAKDLVKGTIWVYFELAVYRYKIVEEDRFIWKIYLTKKDFTNAKLYANKDSIKLDEVICEEAQYYFDRKDYQKSAEMYAQSGKSFDEIALKFMQLKDEEALKKFLTCKLNTLPASNQSQINLITIWLIEIIMSQIGQVKIKEHSSADNSKCDHETLIKLRSEFKELLSNTKIRECISKNKNVIYDIILSQGDEQCLVLFASSVQDYKFAIGYFIERADYDQCLQILREQRNVDLIYRYGPLLMRQVPEKLVNILKAQCLSLDPSKLLPTLIQNSDQNGFKSRQCKEIIHYLEYCIQMGVAETIIHNYLVALYAELDQPKLLEYLETRSDSGNQIEYDLKYALRICSEKKLNKASVILYTTMGDYEEAVDMALQVDMDLAKRTADIPHINDELRRKLWLKIAWHVVKEKRDIQQVSHLLAECNLLKIEDILPFFPDFVTIGHFKDAICSSLKGYCANIDALKEEMKETTESAQQIKQEIQQLRNRYTIVRSDDKCSICGHSILSQPFHAFPCRHMYHQSCLISETQNYLSSTVKERLLKVSKSEKLIDPTINSKSSISGGDKQGTKETAFDDINQLIKSQCLYCGDLMIESISIPLISPDEKSMALLGW